MIHYLIEMGVGPTQARLYAEPLMAAMALYDIQGQVRTSAFLAHALVESANLTATDENMRYSDPARIARIFRSGFDLDRDRVVDPEEIEFARGFVRQPQKLANRVYANRNGNGDEASGDGWLFRGRGIFQLTGRGNYAAASLGCGVGMLYVLTPDEVATPTHAALTAAWYWTKAGCNQLADAGRFDDTTRRINGPAMLHAAERRAFFDQAMLAYA